MLASAVARPVDTMPVTSRETLAEHRAPGQAAIAAPAWAGSFPWVGHTTWYPCGAAPDDRTFLLCGTHQYEELRLGDDGNPQWTSAPADIPVAARNTGGNGDPEFAVSPGTRTG